jgi:hypothetical protein
MDYCPIPLRIISITNSENWQSIIEEELRQPIDITIAPLAKAILIQQSGKCIFRPR